VSEIVPHLWNRSSSLAFKVPGSHSLARCRNTIGPIRREPFLFAPTPQITEKKFTCRLGTILREEGPRALYKGFVPKVLRLAPGGGVLLLVVEFTLDLFRKGGSPRARLGSGD
jgi:Mitochondrial carrier protein